MTYITLDFNGIDTLWNLHEYFMEIFQLPDYYGHNMDALWDCLHCAFESKTTIVLKNLSAIPAELNEAAETMLSLFRDLESQNDEVMVVIENEETISNISDYLI